MPRDDDHSERRERWPAYRPVREMRERRPVARGDELPRLRVLGGLGAPPRVKDPARGEGSSGGGVGRNKHTAGFFRG